MSLLMKTPKHNYWQSCYCKFLCEKFIISCWVLQKKADRKIQESKTIILSSVIQPCKISFHPNLKIRPLDKSYVWVWVLHIHQKHAFIIIIMVWELFNLNIKTVMHENRRYGKISNCLLEINKNTVKTHGKNMLTKFIRLYYTPLVRTWMHWYKMINMVTLINHIQLKCLICD